MKKKISIVIGSLIIVALIYLGMSYYPNPNGAATSPGRIMLGINATQEQVDKIDQDIHNATGSSYDAGATNEAVLNGAIYTTNQTANVTSAAATAKEKGNYTSFMDDRKIIKNGQIQLETLKFVETTINLQNYIKSIGGYIQNSDIQGTGANLKDSEIMRRANFVFMIPSNNFDQFLSKSGDFGYIKSQSSNTQDATEEYSDSKIQLETLKVRKDRLLNIMRSATKLADIISLESEIQNVSYEINSLTSNLKGIDKLVKFSTVSVSVQEVSEIKTNAPSKTKSLGERILFALNQSINAVLSGFQIILIVFATLLPFVFILAIIGIPSYMIYRRAKKQE